MQLDKIYHRISNFLKLSHKEARGFVSLLIFSIIALILLLFPKIVSRQYSNIDPAEVKQLDSLVAILAIDDQSDQNHALFLFNPNKISLDSLVLLGFKTSVAQRLVNYRTKGGRFIYKQDISKIYGITATWMQDLYSFIDLPDRAVGSKAKKATIKFDLNKAGVEQLETITGIGRVFASRIVKYRDVLGGFVSKVQLEEIYDMPEDALRNLKSDTFISSAFKPQKIKINHDNLESLQKHPYISDHLAEDIIRFREVNATIKSEKVLVNFKSVEKSKFEKLILYLDFK